MEEEGRGIEILLVLVGEMNLPVSTNRFHAVTKKFRLWAIAVCPQNTSQEYSATSA